MKYRGSVEELLSIIRSIGFEILSYEEKGNCYQIRVHDGGVLTWYTSTGTIQVQGKEPCKRKLESLLRSRLENDPQDRILPPQAQTIRPTSPENPESANKKVFVVHGHDNTAKEQLELILHKLDLNPFVLQNTSGDGLTIIEALEREIGPGADAARFGIVLLTPDDIGYSKAKGDTDAQPRARQNVVLEMGMLISAIGRGNVAILKKQHIEVPSDAQGIVYIPFNDHVKEAVSKLVDRLRSAGFELTADQIMKATS